MLKERLRQIRHWNILEDDVREVFPYVGHPYIVHFDAWTFAKSNLWASLMQKILSDLDQQLSLEKMLTKAREDILLQGVDIWSLLDGLTKEQIEAFEEELGEDVLKKFKGWEKGEDVGEALWDALKDRRHEEIEELEKSSSELKEAEDSYAINLAEKESELEGFEICEQQKLRMEMTDLQHSHEIELKQMNANRETIESTILAEVDKAMEEKAREAAWGGVKSQMKTFVGNAFDNAARVCGQTNGEVPSSFCEIVEDIGQFRRYIKGLSLSSVMSLGIVPLSLLVGLCITKIPGLEINTTIGGSVGCIFGIVASFSKALKKTNQWLKEQQGNYEDAIEKANNANKNEREALLKDQRERRILPIESSIEKLKHEQKTKIKTLSNIRQGENKRDREVKLTAINDYKQSENDKIKNLKAKVKEHTRRAGITGRSKTLRDLIQERIESKFYDKKLGLLHQVQEDLREISDALLPNIITDEEKKQQDKLFPRGKPRVILIIDDLDRCPPEQVVEMLEATQLLVKTELFVVVLAMDVRYVTKALEKNYDKILECDGQPSGLDYIEKIVQIPYRVPEVSPDAMPLFLQHQMAIVTPKVEEPEPPKGSLPVDKTIDSGDGNQHPVFTSSLTADGVAKEKMLPTQVQFFIKEEVSLLNECCNAVGVNPRSIRRLVNIFKLLKIIWFHRGQHREPSVEVKRAMILLLAVSARYPVAMRKVLHSLHEAMRSNEPQNLREKLTDHLGPLDFLPCEKVLGEIGSDNMRLVRSFSFVGEAEDGEDEAKDTDQDQG
ncbi:MAG: hypothetical protein FVQ79_07205 [Planctomycetes bacterium]|nr:hypothetical protein [Planctomycetota bacterium]